MVADEQVIVVKKKGGHGGHHGGAWKVAYADFVTALMSLFIVMWLMNSSKNVQDAVGGYFRDPHGTAEHRGTQMNGTGDVAIAKNQDMNKLKEELMKAMERMANYDKIKKLIEITVTPEGLQIELMEDPHGTFFELGSAEPTPVLQGLLKVLAPEIGKLPNPLSIEGHTDSKPYSGLKAYGNWELSTDRANTARRLMETSGVRANQVTQVRGFADRRLRKPQQPEDASNRRVTLIIQYLPGPDPLPAVISRGSLPQVK
ncbi:MAG: flagellar motor protein MotB [Terracidiphilus sp.]|jgi:chemotaxis protein MotB